MSQQKPSVERIREVAAETKKHARIAAMHRVASATKKPPTVHELPMGGCSTASAHYAHLDAGDPLCENQR